MASVTRSTRRAEGLHPHHHHANGHARSAPAGLFHHHQGGSGVGAAGKNKRALDGVTVSDREFDAIKPKRARFAVEILARGSTIATDNVRVAPAPANAPAPAPRPKPAAAVVATANPPAPTPAPKATSAGPPAAKNDQNLTKHQAKVINGIKHELDRLQPQAADTKEQGRKLRSQEASRFKSELSAYFPDYDEVIGNEPKEQHTLNVETPILLVDSDAPQVAPRAAQLPHQRPPATQYSVRGYGDALFNDVFDAQRIDFGFLEAQQKNKTFDDPLPDKLFQPVHKRAERLERSIRNTEKGRAQHEKDQIVRLLEGLQGHDWLRIMGVSGVTETKKKTFEPARDHFIKGCQAILDKFRNWSLEEKRRKLEKEKALAEKAEVDGESADTQKEEEDSDTSQDDSSDSASPAKQLHEEAMARSKGSAKGSKRPRPTPQPHPPPRKTHEAPREFTSFFSKKYERDGALNRHRRTGRKVLAWGHPIPEIPECEFDLPVEYRDEDTLKARERKKRRERRGSRY